MSALSVSRVALIGKSGAGKSIASNMLLREYNFEHIKTGTICRNISVMLFDNDDKSSTQLLDDALTQIDESIFLRASLRKCDMSRPYVIDSLRFHSDLEIARQNNCMIVRIKADDDVRLSRLINRRQGYRPEIDGIHRSEIELDSVLRDREIYNNGREDQFLAQLRDLLDKSS